jgi:DNA-binding GntR family transcriptional regulator
MGEPARGSANGTADAAPDAEGAEAETLHQTLLRAILWRDLTSGMKLSEEVIARTFGVARTIVRAAFNRLCAEGLVVFQKNRGAFVATPSNRDADEVFDLRGILGAEAAARLARQITPAQLAEFEDNITAHRSNFRAGNDRDAVRLAEEFHLLLVRMTGNAALETVMTVLICRSALVLAQHRRSKTSELGIDEHVEIVRALRARDPALAATVTRRHIDNVLKRARLTDDAEGRHDLAGILARHVVRPPASASAVKPRPRQKRP